MKKLVNNPASCVDDAVAGLLLSNPNLSRLQGINAVVRRDISSIRDQQVTLISGTIIAIWNVLNPSITIDVV